MLISYAQNFEDVILWRALKHVENGFYIDVGAQDPVVDSVSLAFYERGWRGIHVEPAPAYAEKLRLARSDEEVIEAAVGSGAESITLYEIAETGLSTADPANAQKHLEAGFKPVERRVQQVRLSALLDRFRGREIHWLKIDVEGMEKDVIESWKGSDAHPWIVVVESTLPAEPTQSYGSWDPLLRSYKYEYVYFDGLNRYYVSAAHLELREYFGPGPNVFDDFSLSGLANAPFVYLPNQRAKQALDNVVSLQVAADEARRNLAHTERLLKEARQETQDRLAAGEKRLAEAQDDAWRARHTATQLREEFNTYRQSTEAEIDSLNAALGSALQTIELLYTSSSWKVTAPLRGIKRVVLDAPRVAKQCLKWPVRIILLTGISTARRQPRVAALTGWMLRRFPNVERKVRVVANRDKMPRETEWMLEPDPEKLKEWQSLMRKE